MCVCGRQMHYVMDGVLEYERERERERERGGWRDILFSLCARFVVYLLFPPSPHPPPPPPLTTITNAPHTMT